MPHHWLQQHGAPEAVTPQVGSLCDSALIDMLQSRCSDLAHQMVQCSCVFLCAERKPARLVRGTSRRLICRWHVRRRLRTCPMCCRLLGLPADTNLAPHHGQAKKSLKTSGEAHISPPQAYVGQHRDGQPLQLSGQVRHGSPEGHPSGLAWAYTPPLGWLAAACCRFHMLQLASWSPAEHCSCGRAACGRPSASYG